MELCTKAITTGRRLFEWMRKDGFPDPGTVAYRTGLQQFVIDPNLSEAAKLSRTLRTDSSGTLIDPTAFPAIEGWTQDDFRYVWSRVIERFVQTVVFIDGWEFSNGCSLEFLAARRHDVRTVNQNLVSITLSEGISAIEDAVSEARSTAGSTEFLEAVLAELANIAGVLDS